MEEDISEKFGKQYPTLRPKTSNKINKILLQYLLKSTPPKARHREATILMLKLQIRADLRRSSHRYLPRMHERISPEELGCCEEDGCGRAPAVILG